MKKKKKALCIIFLLGLCSLSCNLFFPAIPQRVDYFSRSLFNGQFSGQTLLAGNNTFFMQQEKKRALPTLKCHAKASSSFKAFVEIGQSEDVVDISGLDAVIDYGTADGLEGFVSNPTSLKIKSSSPSGYYVKVYSDEGSSSPGSYWKLQSASHEHFVEFKLISDCSSNLQPTPIMTHGFCDKVEGGTPIMQDSVIFDTYGKMDSREVNIGLSFYVFPGQLIKVPSGEYRMTLRISLIHY